MFQLKPFSLLLLAGLASSLTIGLAGSPNQAASQTVRFETNVGDIEVQLHPNDAPLSVANFLSYVNAPDVVNDDGSTERRNYDGTFIHRSVPGFVVQGGRNYVPEDRILANSIEVVTLPPVDNEFGISNTRGTLAYARVGGQRNSATSQWFFNAVDNTVDDPAAGRVNLDNVDGGFTVFGTVVSGLDVVDQIQNSLVLNFGISPFTELPILNIGVDFVRVNDIDDFFIVNDTADFVVVNSVSVVPVLRGDVNLDGAVTFADIPLFIARLSEEEYQNEADVDQNAAIDFADIPAFIAILNSQ